MERQGADFQKDKSTTIINQSLRENDKIKEDALSHLSDQLFILSERMQQLEKKNNQFNFNEKFNLYNALILVSNLYII